MTSRHGGIADRLGRIKGRFILSINDVPEIREILSRFDILEVPLNYTVATGKSVPAKELMVTTRLPGSS
jgi:DNA adenine methylase